MECKLSNGEAKDFNDLELIDTLWNVNCFQAFFVLAVSRINRYIMECK